MLADVTNSVSSSRQALGLIIFDCDGVLVDSEVLSIKALHSLILQQGGNLTKDEVIKQFQGRSMKSARDELFSTQGIELTQDSLDEMNRHLFARFKEELQPVVGVTEFIQSLILPCCVASSSHLERIEVSLTATNLRQYFSDKVFSSTMVSRGKPAPDLFLLAAEKMSLSADCALVIEDSPAGVQAARHAGMLCIGLTAGSHAKHPDHGQRLADAGANWVVDNYMDVAKIIRSLS